MKTNKIPATANSTSNSAETNEKEAPTTLRPQNQSNANQKVSASQKSFDPQAGDRFEFEFFSKNYPGMAQLQLPEKISDRVDVMYKHALATNPYKLVYKAAARRFFRVYFDSHPEAFSGQNPFFTEHYMDGCPTKVQFIADLVEIMLAAGWLEAFDPAKGGLVMWVLHYLPIALRRTLGAVNSASGKTTFLTDQYSLAAARNQMKDNYIRTLSEPVLEEEIEKNHLQDVEACKRYVDYFKTMTASARRVNRPKLLQLLDIRGVTEEEAGVPPAKVNQKRIRPLEFPQDLPAAA